MKRKKPIARLTPVRKTAQSLFSLRLEGSWQKRNIQKEALKALDRAGGRFMAKVVIDANVMISAAFGEAIGSGRSGVENHEVYLSLMIERELREVIPGLCRKLTKNKSSSFRKTSNGC